MQSNYQQRNQENIYQNNISLNARQFEAGLVDKQFRDSRLPMETG